VDKLYKGLMQMQEQAFEAGRFQVAYHLLAAALYAAEELNSIELLEELGALASNRQAELDRKEPAHPISSASAHGRGNSALFATLAKTAGPARGRLAADAAVGRMRGHADPAD
jgi:hypothetical protein